MALRFARAQCCNLRKAPVLLEIVLCHRGARGRTMSVGTPGKFRDIMAGYLNSESRRSRSFSPLPDRLKRFDYGQKQSTRNAKVMEEQLNAAVTEHNNAITGSVKQREAKPTYRPYEHSMDLDIDENERIIEENTTNEFESKHAPENKVDHASTRYIVDNSKSIHEKDRFELFEKYRAAHHSRMNGHLQPCKLKPFGTIVDILEPTYKKKFAITFPQKIARADVAHKIEDADAADDADEREHYSN